MRRRPQLACRLTRTMAFCWQIVAYGLAALAACKKRMAHGWLCAMRTASSLPAAVHATCSPFCHAQAAGRSALVDRDDPSSLELLTARLSPFG